MKTFVHTKACTWLFIGSFICNYPKLEATQISLNCLMDKQVTVYLFNEILYSNKKEQLSIHAKIWINLKYVKGKKWDSNIIYCMNPLIWHSEKDKNIETENKGHSRGTVDYNGAQGDFCCDEMVLHVDFDSGYTTVCLCQPLWNYTLKKVFPYSMH